MHDHVKYDDLCIDKFEPKLGRDMLINEWGGARKMYGAYVFLLLLCCSCRGGGELNISLFLSLVQILNVKAC